MNSCNLKRTHLLYLALSFICSLWRCFGTIFTCSNCTMMGRRPGLIIKSPSKIRFEGSITGGYRRILPLIRRRLSMLKFLLLLGGMVMLKGWSLVIFFTVLCTFNFYLLLGRYDLGRVQFMLFDNTSFFLIVLSIIIACLMLLSSGYIHSNNFYSSFFQVLNFFILFFLLVSFGTSDLFLFYIFFESSLIPIFLIIIGWGYQPERIRASLYLLFYTLAASLPLLLGIFWLQRVVGSAEFSVFIGLTSSNNFLFFILIIAFLVKIPIFIVHLWLPKAHVEAPVAGSMILAGVLLKLGGYGLIRLFSVFYQEILFFSSFLLTISLIGGVLACFICFRQVDRKSLIAYSSVAHIALVLTGLVIITTYGWWGCYTIILAHGICSSGLFCLVGLCYSRLGSRSIFIIRGMLMVSPLFTLWWFLFSIFNMGAPPSLNLFGEVLIFISSFSWLSFCSFVVGLISFLSAAYSLFLFSCTQHGKLNYLVGSFCDVECREHFVLFSHLFPLLLIVPLVVEVC